MGFFNFHGSLMGIDLGASALKAVLLSPSRKGIKLEYAGLVELPRENGNGSYRDLPMAIQSLLQSRELRRCKSVINVAGKPPLIRYLTLPYMPKEELKEAVKWEAKKLMALPIEEMVTDFLVVGEQEERGQRRYEVVLVAAERIAVMNALREIQRAGVKVAAVDANPLSLLNTIRLNYRKDLPKGIVFIDIGARKTEINIARNGILKFTRTVQMGGQDLTEALQRGLTLDFEEAEALKRDRGISPNGGDISDLITQQRYLEVMKESVDRLVLEVQRSLDYYRAQFREDAAAKLVLMGGTPLMPGFSDYFSSYFDMKVELDDPFSGIICKSVAISNFKRMAPRFSSSIGLALRNMVK